MTTGVVEYFTQTDPLEADVGSPYPSAYMYGNNNPLVYTDPSGLRGQKPGSSNPLLRYPKVGAGSSGFRPTRRTPSAAESPCEKKCGDDWEFREGLLWGGVNKCLEKADGDEVKEAVCWEIFNHGKELSSKTLKECLKDCEKEASRSRVVPRTVPPRTIPRTVPPWPNPRPYPVPQPVFFGSDGSGAYCFVPGGWL